MEKTALKGIKTIAPFDSSYIKVGARGKWNLMDRDGNILSPTWFSEIEKGTDGYVKVSLPAPRAKTPGLSLSFSSVAGMGRAAKAIASDLPAFAFRFVSPESVEPISRPGFVARATAYGLPVLIDSKGRLFDKDGKKELKFIIDTSTTEKILSALRKFNKRMHYETRECEPEHFSYYDTWENKISAWAFYFVSDDLCVCSGRGEHVINTDTKKWTDKVVLRVFDNLLPQGVMEKLKKTFGTPAQERVLKCRPNEPMTDWNIEDFSTLASKLDAI